MMARLDGFSFYYIFAWFPFAFIPLHLSCSLFHIGMMKKFIFDEFVIMLLIEGYPQLIKI